MKGGKNMHSITEREELVDSILDRIRVSDIVLLTKECKSELVVYEFYSKSYLVPGEIRIIKRNCTKDRHARKSKRIYQGNIPDKDFNTSLEEEAFRDFISNLVDKGYR